MTIPELARLIEEEGLSSWGSSILEKVRPGIGLARDTQGVAGFNRLGGMPDMPLQLAWPEHEGNPLHFVGQFQFSTLVPFSAAGILPPTGRLWFFCDLADLPSGWKMEEKDRWRVLFAADETAPLIEREPPPGMDTDYALRRTPLSLREILTVPGTRSIELGNLADMQREEMSKYFSLQYAVEEVAGSPRHRLLGHPAPVQGCMQRIAQFVTHGAGKLPAGVHSFYEHPRAAELIPGASDWLLLLQVDSDEKLSKFYFGDAGLLYFWIRRDDLKARRFDRVWFFMQCG